MDNLKLLLEILRYINGILASIPIVLTIIKFIVNLIKKVIDFIKSKKYSLKDFKQFTGELETEIKNEIENIKIYKEKMKMKSKMKKIINYCTSLQFSFLNVIFLIINLIITTSI